MREQREARVSRKGFLARLAAGAALLFGVKRAVKEAGPVETELRECDFYSRHDLAG